MASSSDYRLGSIPIARFDPSVETEIRKTRPAIDRIIIIKDSQIIVDV